MQVSRFYKHPVPVLIFGAFIISFSSVFVKTSQVPALVSAFYRVFFGCLFLVGACWIKGEFRKKSLKKNLLAILWSGQSFAIQGTASLFSLLGLGFFSNSLPGVPASRAGLILLLQPALSFVWDVFFFNRQTGGVEWAGVGMVLVAIYLGMMFRAKN